MGEIEEWAHELEGRYTRGWRTYLAQRLGLAQGQKSKAAHDTQLEVDLGARNLY